MNFDNYIFDFDGTLADTTSCHVYATQQAFKKLKLEEPSVDKILEALDVSLDESFKIVANQELTEQELMQLVHTYHIYYSEYEIHYLKEYSGIS